MTIPATIELADASSRLWDVVVVGAGPAGTMAAHQIARLGNEVLLLDKSSFPRFKVCGCCLNPDSQATLRAAGLQELIARLGAVPIKRFRIGASGSRIADVPLRGTVCVSRQAFDEAMVKTAVDAGAAFLPQAEARLGTSTKELRGLVVRCQNVQAEIKTRVLLAADGVGSSLMRESSEVTDVFKWDSRIGAGIVVESASPDYEPGTIYMACSKHGYVGLVRLEDNRLDIAAALDRSQVKHSGGIGPMAVQIIRDANLPAIPALEQMKWQGTPVLTRKIPATHYERAFLIGDAAGYVEPFTGEGIAWALASGMAVAPIAHRAADCWSSAVGEEWECKHRLLVKKRQWLCRMLARGLRHPTLMKGSVNILSRFPFLAAPLTRALTASKIRNKSTSLHD